MGLDAVLTQERECGHTIKTLPVRKEPVLSDLTQEETTKVILVGMLENFLRKYVNEQNYLPGEETLTNDDLVALARDFGKIVLYRKKEKLPYSDLRQKEKDKVCDFAQEVLSEYILVNVVEYSGKGKYRFRSSFLNPFESAIETQTYKSAPQGETSVMKNSDNKYQRARDGTTKETAISTPTPAKLEELYALEPKKVQPTNTPNYRNEDRSSGRRPAINPYQKQQHYLGDEQTILRKVV